MSTRFERVRLAARQRRRLRRGGRINPIIISDDDENVSTPPIYETECPICKDTLNQCKTDGRELMSTICGHVFCRTCIGQLPEQPGVWHFCPACMSSTNYARQYPSNLHMNSVTFILIVTLGCN